ncbi:MAG: hypothetical protein ACLPT4_07450 [Verrucomicrobiia bacterium]
MNVYRSDYANQVHQLIVSISKHFYILKSGDLVHQWKPMEVKLPKAAQSSREHIVHYLIRDHFSGAFYAEMCSARAMVPVEEFLYRAWSKKENYFFCGLPFGAIIPNGILTDRILNLLENLEIRLKIPTAGFQTAVVSIRHWEEELRGFDLLHSIVDGKVINRSEYPKCGRFADLQARSPELCNSINDKRWGRSNRKEWEQHLQELRLPPERAAFLALCEESPGTN